MSDDFSGNERFEVKRRLGQGGMGVVYEAYDRVRGAHVALKTLNKFDAQAIYRMKQEFRALADVSHPNLAQLHELFSAGDYWFFTMELVDGVDYLTYVRGGVPEPVPAHPIGDSEVGHVSAWARSGPPSEQMTPESRISNLTTLHAFRDEHAATTHVGATLIGARDDVRDMRPAPRPAPKRLTAWGIERIRQTLKQLAEGVLALHETAKLHRDIKPSNVMVRQNGHVVLLDFGLVTPMYEEWLIKSTLEGMLCGTVAYMAPEQSSGQPLSPATDWYSVGVMLFEALTDRLPFEGKLFDILLNKQRLDAPEPRAFVLEVPEDLNQLCVDLLRRAPEERPLGRDVLRRLGADFGQLRTPMAAWQVPPLQAEFVGREPHLTMLSRAFAVSRSDHPVLVHVHGRSGMGKSALVKHFVDDLMHRREAIVLGGRCYEREIVPYKAFDSVIDALSRYLRKLPREEVNEIIGPDVRSLARIFPTLKRVEAIREAPAASVSSPDPVELRRRAFASLREILDNVARKKPLVIFIDDLQWGDSDSATLLADLLRPPHPAPLLVIACHRTEDRESSSLLRALEPRRGSDLEGVDIREVYVGPLEEGEAETLARSLLAQVATEKHAWVEDGSDRDGDAGAVTQGEQESKRRRSVAADARTWVERARSLARESRGSPMFLWELACFSSADGLGGDLPPGQLDSAIRARFRALPEDARRLLEVVSVAARPLRQTLANRAAGLGTENLSAPAILRSGRLIRVRSSDGQEDIEAYHNRVGEAVLQDLPEERVRELHRALARELEKTEDADPEALVLHLRAAGELERAGDHATRAAARASEALAFQRAASLYQLCADLTPPTRSDAWDVRRKLGDALVSAGRGAEAAEAYLSAADMAPKAIALEMRRRAAEQLLQSGHFDRGIDALREVLGALDLQYPATPKKAFRSINILRIDLLLRGLGFREQSADLADPEDLMRIDVCWSATTGLGMLDLIRASYFHTRQLRLALKVGEPYRLARALASEVAFVGGIDRDLSRTARVLEELKKLDERLDHPHAHGLVALAAGFAAFLGGRWSEAALESERAIRIHSERCAGVEWELDTARFILFSSLAYKGELGQLPERVQVEIKEADLRRSLYASTVLRVAPNVSLVWLARDDVEYARSQVLFAMERWSDEAFLLPHFHALLSEVQFDLYEGAASSPWKRIEARWPRLEESMLLRANLIRVEGHWCRARAALAAALEGREVESLLSEALSDAKKIERTRMPQAGPLALFLRAQVAVLRNEVEPARQMLERAESELDASAMGLHRAAAMRLRGQLAGGEPGRALVDSADAWMRARSVVRPDRMTAMLAPVARLDARTRGRS